MTDTYDLSKLGTEAFENIVNFLALKTIGLGTTGFCPGADGGRDGYFEGEAPYPSSTDRWDGIWYIQSKFHAPHLSKDPQKWLVNQVAIEIKKFERDETDRTWPNNWIIATNIDPSGKPNTGSFDKIRTLLNKSEKGKKVNLHIWGGRKILDMLALNDDAAEYYGHFLTPGHIISALYKELSGNKVSVQEIIRYFVVSQFTHHTYSKLDQAGSSTDDRPGVHDLFIDLPFTSSRHVQDGLLSELCKTSSHSHRYSLRSKFPETWKGWMSELKRARVILVKGGPGQGKSTIGQYFCQIHRAFLILSDGGPNVIDSIRELALQVCTSAKRDAFWPTEARIPIQVELKEFAHWYSQRKSNQTHDVLNYISETVSRKIGTEVSAKTIKNLISKQSWIVVFDGLDEVPNDSKSNIADEILYFLNDVVIEIDGDVFALCTSRPQGYSGQFSDLDGPTAELSLLDTEQAINCAKPLLKFGRNSEESEKSIQILDSAIYSPNVKELMTTPLQSHIMAVVIRDGGRPPERRWQLFNSFYQVMKKRESLKDFKNPRIAKLLREDDLLLKSVHMRLGFVLHAQAERSEGAQTTLKKDDFRKLVNDVVTELVEHEVKETVDDVMEATTERLVLVSTPESGEEVRFDIRQLQEFFASEFIHTEVDPEELAKRIETIAGDQHWREVMHFLMSALIENRRITDVAIAIAELRKLNEGDEPNSLYHRRAAKAVPLCNRLILEGVLEQDLKVRQRVKPLLDPLGGKLDIESLKDLIYIKPTNSRYWLIQVLIEKISISNSDEYVGALYLLAWMLPENHSETKKIIDAFLVSPTKAKENLFYLWANDINIVLRDKNHPSPEENNDEKLSSWVIQVAIKILNSADWLKYSNDTVDSLLEICHSNKKQFISACKKENINLEMSTVITKSWQKNPYHLEGKDTEKLKIGFIKASLYKESWENGFIPSVIKDIDPEKYLTYSDGYFKLMLLCMSFSKTKNYDTLSKIICSFKKISADHIGCLPRYLLALIPVAHWYDKNPFCVEHLVEIDTDSNNLGFLEARKVGIKTPLRRLSIDREVEVTIEDWLEVAMRLPTIAISLLLNSSNDPLFDSTVGDSRLEAISNPIIEKVLLDNFVTTSSYIGSWGIFNQENPELLTKLKEKSKEISSHSIKTLIIRGQISPFPLELPQDAKLLPLLAQILILNHEQGLRHTRIYLGIGLKIFKEYGLTTETLRKLATSNEFDVNTRAGALALYWLFISIQSKESPDKSLNLDLSYERFLYKELVNEHNEKWLTRSLISGILIKSKESDEYAVAFVSDLLEYCKGGDGPHKELVKLLRVWQERSNAPINSEGTLAKWLGYNIEIPPYVSSEGHR